MIRALPGSCGKALAFAGTSPRTPWLSRVGRFFRDLTVNRLRRGVFRSVPELVAAPEKSMAQNNREPKPFIGTAKADESSPKWAAPGKTCPASVRHANFAALRGSPAAKGRGASSAQP